MKEKYNTIIDLFRSGKQFDMLFYAFIIFVLMFILQLERQPR